MSTSSRTASLRALARVGALALGVLVLAAGAARAQEAAAPAQPQAQGMSFSGEAGVLFWPVKPDKTADFEQVMTKFKEALQKSEDPTRKQMAAGLRVYKTSPWVAPGGKEPDPAQNVLYLLLVDPAAQGGDYSPSAILKTLYEAFPSDGKDLYQKFTESSGGGRNVLNLKAVVK